MPDNPDERAMRQKIFSMNLDIETISLYLLCCALADAGAAITVETLADKWNGDRASLERELGRLEHKNIIRKDQGREGHSTTYRLVEEDQWS